MKHYLEIIQLGDELTQDQAEAVMDIMMSGEADDVQMAALLMGLSVRGETTNEIVGMLRSMRKHMETIDLGDNLVDTCGTGGDGHNTFNISTAAALVCASMGVQVAKHGNRAASSQCGSADFLEALGVPLEMTPEEAQQYFTDHNFVFLYARQYHPAMKHVAGIRKQIGIRTIFNFLGPLCNPAQAKRQIIGVSDPGKANVLGQALIELGSERVLVVYSDDGLDEASPAAGTTVVDFTAQGSKRFRIEPKGNHSLDDIKGGLPQDNVAIMEALANGKGTAAQIEVVAMNAGLALLAAGAVDTYEEGRAKAEEVLRSHKLVRYMHSL